jgi:hypothetical protein
MVFAASPLSMWRLVGSKSGQWSDMQLDFEIFRTIATFIQKEFRTFFNN